MQGHSVPAASLDLHRESEGSRRNKTVPWLDGTGQEWVSQPPSRALVGRGGPGPASCILAKVEPQNGERRATGRSDFPPPTSPGDRTEGGEELMWGELWSPTPITAVLGRGAAGHALLFVGFPKAL